MTEEQNKLAEEIPAWVAEERAKQFVPWLLESLAREPLGNPIVKADAAKALAALREPATDAVRDALSNLVSLMLQTMEPIGPMRDRSDYPPELQTAINALKGKGASQGSLPAVR